MARSVNKALLFATTCGAAVFAALQTVAMLGSPAIPPGFSRIDIGGTRDLMVSERAVTRREWDECVNAGSCQAISAFKSPDAPLTMVNWYDANQYIAWRSSRDSLNYRLPSYEEWMLFAADHAPSPTEKLFTAPELAWAADYDTSPRPSGSASLSEGEEEANHFGLIGLSDRVWEWTASCQEDETSAGDCRGARIAMGRHKAVMSELVSDPGKAGCGGGTPPDFVGFRLVVDLGVSSANR